MAWIEIDSDKTVNEEFEPDLLTTKQMASFIALGQSDIADSSSRQVEQRIC